MDHQSEREDQQEALPTTPGQGLAPYTGYWDCDQAAHLLRRTIHGPNYDQIKEVAHLGLDASLELLFQELPLPEPPIIYDDKDPHVSIGKTWVNARYCGDIDQCIEVRHRSLKAWTITLIYEEGISIREKLTLFWHNHFAVNDIGDPKYLYRYITTLRQYSWGNFRDLVKLITVDPAMLRFLNSYQNTATAPNENYARELLELFTIGKGPLVGPGDYTNYTEHDVIQVARILTGWQDTGYKTTNRKEQVGALFQKDLHDKGVKELSHRFNNVCVPNLEDQEYTHFIDLIFEQAEVARFICRKLYRWFVYYDINAKVEAEVIEPMAKILINHNFEIKPALLALLRSEHFFASERVGLMIKNPIDFFMSAAKGTYTAIPTEIFLKYKVINTFYNTLEFMQMDYYNPPSVAGWKAYYQEPLFYRAWINTPNLLIRKEIALRLILFGQFLFGFVVQINVLDFIARLDNPQDPNLLLEEICLTLLSRPLSQAQQYSLKEILLPGLPDYEWTVEYNKYLANPDDEDLAKPIENKLRLLLDKIIELPEFNLS